VGGEKEKKKNRLYNPPPKGREGRKKERLWVRKEKKREKGKGIS